MKNFKVNTGHFLTGMLLLLCIVGNVNNVSAQKILNEQETRIVEEAQNDLSKAISDPAMEQSERLRLVERSAKTLKQYGQPPAFPKGNIPLKTLMQRNFDEASKQYNDVNELRNKLNKMNLEAKMKFINALQIEVVEEQIKLLVPGSELEYDMSMDLVGTVLGWNIVEGVNQGDVDDARSLVALLKKSAQNNKLAIQLDELFKDHQFNMQELHRDLNMVGPLEAQLRKKYEMAAASEFVFKDYEGASATQKEKAQMATKTIKTNEPKLNASNEDFKETKFYYRLIKIETVKKVNNEMYIKSIEVSDNAMSASVTPPKPKEPFTTTANWNSPPSTIYPGDVVTLTAKGTGDARIKIEASNSRTVFCEGVRDSGGNGNSTVNFSWKVSGGSENMYISVNTLVTANTWGWTAAWFNYEYVVIE